MSNDPTLVTRSSTAVSLSLDLVDEQLARALRASVAARMREARIWLTSSGDLADRLSCAGDSLREAHLLATIVAGDELAELGAVAAWTASDGAWPLTHVANLLEHADADLWRTGLDDVGSLSYACTALGLARSLLAGVNPGSTPEPSTLVAA